MKNLKFYAIVSWIIFSRGFDAYCTHLHTPDLQKEANPLVSFLGLTWSPLLICLFLLMLYVCYAYYQYVFKPMQLDPEEKGFTFMEFVSYRYLGKKAHWSALLFQFPASIHRFNQFMGQLMAPCLAFAGILSTCMWVFIFQSDWYRSVHNAGFIYGILIIGCGFIGYFSFRTKYMKYSSCSA